MAVTEVKISKLIETTSKLTYSRCILNTAKLKGFNTNSVDKAVDFLNSNSDTVYEAVELDGLYLFQKLEQTNVN